MKKLVIYFCIGVLVNISCIAYSMEFISGTEVVNSSRSNYKTVENAPGIVCREDMRKCLIGRHVVVTNSKQPLYVKEGIVCKPNRRVCSNGFTWIRSTKPLY